MDAVERRARRARADDVQAGRDSVPRVQPRRHVARASDRTTSPPRRRPRSCAQGGLGALSAIDVSKKLAGKTAAVRPDIEEMSEGLSGRALRRDLETMFQLIYLTFTQPRADPEAFRAA